MLQIRRLPPSPSPRRLRMRATPFLPHRTFSSASPCPTGESGMEARPGLPAAPCCALQWRLPPSSSPRRTRRRWCAPMSSLLPATCRYSVPCWELTLRSTPPLQPGRMRGSGTLRVVGSSSAGYMQQCEETSFGDFNSDVDWEDKVLVGSKKKGTKVVVHLLVGAWNDLGRREQRGGGVGRTAGMYSAHLPNAQYYGHSCKARD